jgi:hypothetical protein
MSTPERLGTHTTGDTQELGSSTRSIKSRSKSSFNFFSTLSRKLNGIRRNGCITGSTSGSIVIFHFQGKGAISWFQQRFKTFAKQLHDECKLCVFSNQESSKTENSVNTNISC